MKKRILSLSLLCLLALSWGTQSAWAAPSAAVPVSDAVVATYDPADYAGGEILVVYDSGACEVVETGDGSLEDTLRALASQDGVALVQPNYVYEDTSTAGNDPLFSRQWALSNDGTLINLADHTSAVAGIDINAEEAWKIYGEGKRDVVIALIDTGVEITHPELADSIWVNEDEIPGNGIDDDGNGYIDDTYGWDFYYNNHQVYNGSEDSHGTHAAGTIAASSDNGQGIAGIVPGDRVSVMVLKVLGGSSGKGSTVDVVRAIQYAEANGASICNLSLGGTSYDPALYQAMANSSMLFVVAAGNDGVDTDAVPTYPASYSLENLIAVANVSYDGTLNPTSNYGAVSVDLGAPGSYILSTAAGSGYAYMTGTSMAAPMVTAAAALVYSYYDDISLADVRTILLSSTSPLSSLSGKTVTGGMLDLAAALSFDRSDLPTAGTSNGTVSGSSAPQISVERVVRDGVSCLQVRVTDPDGDLAALSYAPGMLFTSQFAGGSLGTPFTLQNDGTALFRILTSGMTYTFYARDAAGNETVIFAEL